MKKKRIAIDARGISIRGGVHNYIVNLLTHLVKLDVSHEWIVFCNSHSVVPILGIHEWYVLEGNKFLWEQRKLRPALKKYNIDLLHSPKHIAPFGVDVLRIATIWDSAYFDHPEFYFPFEAWYWRTLTKLTAKEVNAIIVTTDNSTKDLVRVGLPGNKIVKVPLAVSDFYRRTTTVQQQNEVKKEYGITNDFYLYVGTQGPKKNIETAIKAFALVLNKYPKRQFIIVGRSRPQYRKKLLKLAKQLGVLDKIIFTGFVKDGMKVLALYQSCSMFLFPTLFEGYGLPIMEALCAGTCVLTSNIGPVPEVSGGCALLLPPKDIELWSETMLNLELNPEKQKEMRVNAREYAQKFTWHQTALDTLKVYEDILCRKKTEKKY